MRMSRFNGTRIIHSDRELLTALRRFSRSRQNQPFTTAEWDAWPDRPAWSTTYIRRFGSWRAALRKLGLQAKAHRYTHDEVLAAFNTARKRLRPSRPLRPADLYRHSPLSRTPMIRIWGSPRRACHLYNLYRSGHLTGDEFFTAGPAPGQRRPSAGASLTLRFKILKRDNYKCTLCGRSPATNSATQLEVDHIFPISRGGADHESNLRTLCRECNQGKKAQAIEIAVNQVKKNRMISPFAPSGRRNVATGEAQRNPWTTSHFNVPPR